MSRVYEAREKVEEILQNQVPPSDNEAVTGFYRQQVTDKRNNIEPLLGFVETSLKIIPGFIRDGLLDKADKEVPDREMETLENMRTRLAGRLEENFDHVESLRTLIQDVTGHSAPEGLSVAQLQDLYCRSVYYNEHLDFALDILYQRMATMTHYLPNMLIAPIVKLALSPYIAARVTEHLQAKKAADMAKYFGEDFLGDLVTHLSAAKTAQVSELMSYSRVASIVRYMLSREYFPHNAAVLDAASPGLANRLAGELRDPVHRAAVIQFLQKKDRVELVASFCSDEERRDLAERLKQMQSHHAAVLA